MRAVIAAVLAATLCESREVVNFDFAWRFFKGNLQCTPGSFIEQNGYRCDGLHFAGNATAQACKDICCNDPQCRVWQWLNGAQQNGGCWIGECSSNPIPDQTWVGGVKTNNVTYPASHHEYDDATWEVVDAPHDFLIGSAVSPSAVPDQGYIPRSDAWYRKHFIIPESWSGRTIWIYFEGVFKTTTMYLNGVPLGVHESGYTSFHYRIDNVTSLNYNTANVLSIFVDGTVGTGWWYEGAGIYRHVQIVASDKIHVDVDGTFAPAELLGDVVNGTAPAVIYASSYVVNDAQPPSSAEVEVAFVLYDPSTSTIVASGTSETKTIGSVGVGFNATVSIPSAKLWSVSNPNLYVLSSIVRVGNNIVDVVNTTVGVRGIEYTADSGFYLNNEHVKIRGFCDHNNFAVVGMAVPDRVKLFAAQSLRSIGGNGRRMSHNPPEPVMIDIYDRLGVLVMDENRQFGNNPAFVMNMGAMVKRDRNHPSIVIWSYCNENGCGGNATAGAPFRDITYKYDGTRPTLGNNVYNTNLNKYMDVQGFSHMASSEFLKYHSQFPKKPTFASECCSCESMRGEDVSSSADGGVIQNFNADCVASQTNASDGLPFMSGTMVWTLFDYFGESHGWPHVSSMYGQFDVAGFRKAASYWYETWWPSTRGDIVPSHTCHIVEHWAKDVGGPSRTVHVYTNAPSVELFLNGASQGVKTVPTLGYGQWDNIQYAQGRLDAKAMDGSGRVVSTDFVVSGGTPSRLVLKVDAPSPATGTGAVLYGDGQDVALLRVEVQDSEGNVLNTANSQNVTFEVVSGPGRVLGAHNGDPRNHVPNHSQSCAVMHGLVRGVVQVTEDYSKTLASRQLLTKIDVDSGRRTKIVTTNEQPSPIVVKASCTGFSPVTVTISVSADPSYSVLDSASAFVRF